MINNSSDTAGSPAMRTVYIRASTQTRAIVPRPADPAGKPALDDGVVSLVSRSTVEGPAPARIISPENGSSPPAVMELFAWQTAQAMLADPMQTLRVQSAPLAENVTALLGNRFG